MWPKVVVLSIQGVCIILERKFLDQLLSTTINVVQHYFILFFDGSKKENEISPEIVKLFRWISNEKTAAVECSVAIATISENGMAKGGRVSRRLKSI